MMYLNYEYNLKFVEAFEMQENKKDIENKYNEAALFNPRQAKDFKLALSIEEKNIENIMGEFRSREDKEYFSRYVDKKEIEGNDYNLSVSTYVEKEDTREVIDIKVLNKEIAETGAKIDKLRAAINEIVEELQDE